MASAEAGSIGRGVRIMGELTASGDLVIEGQVEGIVRAESAVRVAPGGCVRGEVHAARIAIEGEAHGRLDAKALALAAGSVTAADVRVERLAIAEAAAFSGTVEMEVALPADLAAPGSGSR